MIDGLIDVLLLLAILVALVVVHAFGHFIVARRAGVRVHEFGIGFPPRAKVFARDSETIYTLNWLPIGGFVRLEGEEGESDDPRSFVRQPLATRLVILLAGVTMNIVLAFVIFSVIAAAADPVSLVRIGGVEPGGPADQAGLRGGRVIDQDARGRPIYDESGELIVAVDGRRFPIFDRIEDPTPSITYLRDHAGQQVTLTVRDSTGAERQVPVTLRVPGPEQGPLGITLYPRLAHEETQNDPLTALAIGARRTLDAATLILRGLQGLVQNLANPPVSGPVGIVGAIGVVRSQPPLYMFWLIGLLSANLAIVNALPFPPLDGGRVAVSLIQAVSGNRVSAAAERLVYLTGFILLMALLVWITLFDTGILERQGG